MEFRVVKPSESVDVLPGECVSAKIRKYLPIMQYGDRVTLGKQIVHRMAKAKLGGKVCYFSSFSQDEEKFFDSFVELYNASVIRQEYYNSKQLAAYLSGCYFGLSLRDLSSGLLDFVEKLSLENDRGVCLKLLRNIEQNVLKFVTNSLLGYEEVRLSYLVQNLETEPLLSIFRRNRLTGFALVALGLTDAVSQKIPLLKVFEYSLSDILADSGLENAPISKSYVQYVPILISNIFNFFELQHVALYRDVLDYPTLKSAVCKYVRNSEFGALKSDTYRENSLGRMLSKNLRFDMYTAIFAANGLEYQRCKIYTFYDALFYPLIIRFLHYKQNAVPLTALNIPFEDVQQLWRQIARDQQKALEDCYMYKASFAKITQKSRHSNITLGVYALRYITVDLSRCFEGFNFDQKAPIFNSESLLLSLSCFETFYCFSHLLVRTLLHAGWLFNYRYVTALDGYTRARIQQYYYQLGEIVLFFYKFDAAVAIQRFCRNRQFVQDDAAVHCFYRFRVCITNLYAYVRGLNARRYIITCKSAVIAIYFFTHYLQARILLLRNVVSIYRHVRAVYLLYLAEIEYQMKYQMHAAAVICAYARGRVFARRMVALAERIATEYTLYARHDAEMGLYIKYALKTNSYMDSALQTDYEDHLVDQGQQATQAGVKAACCAIQRTARNFLKRCWAESQELVEEQNGFYYSYKSDRRNFQKKSIQDDAHGSTARHLKHYYCQCVSHVAKRPMDYTVSGIRCIKQYTPLYQAVMNSYAAILEAQNPFAYEMNLERVYHAVYLNSGLANACQTAEFLCTLFACVARLPVEVRTAPRRSFRRHGVVLLALLARLYNPILDVETAHAYPLHVREVYYHKRLAFGKQAVYAVLDAGILVCSDFSYGFGIGTSSAHFATLISSFKPFQNDPRVLQVRTDWKHFCTGLGPRGIVRIRQVFCRPSAIPRLYLCEEKQIDKNDFRI